MRQKGAPIASRYVHAYFLNAVPCLWECLLAKDHPSESLSALSISLYSLGHLLKPEEQDVPPRSVQLWKSYSGPLGWQWHRPQPKRHVGPVDAPCTCSMRW